MILDKIKEILSSFDEWHCLYQNSKENSDLAYLAFLKMVQSASSTEDWEKILNCTADRVLRRNILKKILQETSTFDKLYQFYETESCKNISIFDPEILNDIFEKILQSDDIDFDRLLKIYCVDQTTIKLEHKEIILERILQIDDIDLDKLLVVYEKALTEKHKGIVLEKILQNNNLGFDKLLRIYILTDDEYGSKKHKPIVLEIILEKAKKLKNPKIKEIIKEMSWNNTYKTNFWDWYQSFLSLEEEEAKDFVLCMLAELAENFWEWRNIYTFSPEDSYLKKLALQKMAETAKGFEEKKRTCLFTPQNSEIRKEIGKIINNKRT